MLPKGGHITP